MITAKRILRYVKGTCNYGQLVPNNRSCRGDTRVYTDSNWCGDKTEGRSTSEYVFQFVGNAFSWSSKMQSIVALSSREVEYVAASTGACQAIWSQNLLNKMHVKISELVKLFVDNLPAICLARNLVFHGRSKHIETRFHFIRDLVNRGKFEMVYYNTEAQVADVLTKPLKLDRFLKLTRDFFLGVFSLDKLD